MSNPSVKRIRSLCQVAREFRGVLWGCAILWGVCPVLAWGVEIKTAEWGFNGQVVLHKFNILTLEVSNPDAKPFDGELRLAQGTGIRRAREEMRQSVFLGPGETKIVQFYPYIESGYDQWVVMWDRESYNLPTIRNGPKASVWLDESNALSSTGGGLRKFSVDQFPPHGTATESLGLVAMDSAPRMDQTRRVAFMDWLNRGGELHLFHTAEARFPQFTGELAILNSPLERQSCGQGLVIRHAQRRDGYTFPEEPANTVATNHYGGTSIDFAFDEIGQDVQRALRRIVDPQHLWPLIWCMAVIYLLMVFPGAYLLGKRTKDFRLVFAVEIGIAILFSWGFSVVGRRGYNESSTNTAVGVAKPMGNGQWDVSLWSNVFVTDGGNYDLVHSGKNVLITSDNLSREVVNGYSRSGAEAVLHVDIPPFSSRAVRCKAAVKHPVFDVKSKPMAGGGPTAIELTVGPDFPSDVTQLAVLSGEKLYSLQRKDQTWVSTSETPLQQVVSVRSFPNAWNTRGRTRVDNQVRRVEETFEQLWQPMTRQAALEWLQERKSLRETGRMRVLVYAPMPEAFFLKNPLVGKSSGRVLYTIDLYSQGTP